MAIATANTRIKIPTFNPDKDDYDTYIHEVNLWKIIGKVDAKEQAMLLVYELSKDDSTGIRDKILNEIPIEDLNKEDGMKKYMDYMNKHFKKDDSVAIYEAYLNFEKCKKKRDEEISVFVLRYDKQSNIAKKKKVTYPDLVLALKLLDNCQLSDVDRKFVLSEMKLTEDTIYDDTKKALIKYKSNNVCSASNTQNEIKIEEGFVNKHFQEALVAAGWTKPRSNSNPERTRNFDHRRNSNQRKNNEQSWRRQNENVGKNPKRYGQHLTCFECGSINHMQDRCPKNNRDQGRQNYNNTLVNEVLLLDDNDRGSWRDETTYYTTSGKKNVTWRDETTYCTTENVILYSGNNKNDLWTLCQESINCAILDSACSANVCGSEWFETLITSFDNLTYAQIKVEKGIKMFKFGGDEILTSTKSVTFPCTIAESRCKITTDVVESSIPLLLSIKSMKKLEMLWDLASGRARIMGVWVDLIQMSVGHYGIEIKQSTVGAMSLSLGNGLCLSTIETCLVNMPENDDVALEKQLRHIHRQFGHPTAEKWEMFMKLCREGVWTQKKRHIMNQIYTKCKNCKVFKKTPPRPIVKLPITCDFNKIVTLDLKEKKAGRFNYILHIIDAFTRLSSSVFICSKETKTIVKQFSRAWIAVGYGAP